MRLMTFPTLVNSGLTDCGGGSTQGLSNLMKQFNHDKSLQQDRFYQQQQDGESSNSNSKIFNGFKSPAKASNIQHSPFLIHSSDNLANEFFQQQEQLGRSPLGSPLLSFQPQKSPSPLLFQQQSPIIVHQQADWTREFRSSQPTTPSYDEFDHIYQRHTSKSPLFSWTAKDFYHHQQHHVASSDVSEEEQQLSFEKAFEEVVVVSAEKDQIQYDRDWDREFEDQETWEAEAEYDNKKASRQRHTYIDRTGFQAVSPPSTLSDVQVISPPPQQQQVPVRREYKGNIDVYKKEEKEKEETKVWDRLQPDGKPYGYRALHPDYNTYHHMTDNPYLIHQDAIDSIPHPSLADAILALEAKLQLHPKNAKAWEQLGLKQQENERDSAAITALEKAVSLDPAGCLGAWLALAVSYTNEHCRMDAYNCLEQWIEHNAKYKHLVKYPLGQNYNNQTKRHAYMTHLFLEAARIAPIEMDADVQIGLGVLFNMSEEYEKAVDCFKASLASRPTDYQLWNKVGATLANARDSLGAIEMYFQALQINPLYVRARYNLAISCMNLGQHLEAAEYLLTALSLQREAALSAGQSAKAQSEEFAEATAVEIPNGTSNSIWDSLRLLMYMMSREDLAAQCDHRNLNAFQGQFDF